MHSEWSLIVLAAGKGTRMGGNIPKPLVELAGKPLIQPVLELSRAIPVTRTIVVISPYTAAIRDRFPGFEYVECEALGTGYCAAQGLAEAGTQNVLIAQADDSYFYRADTLQALMTQHEQAAANFTLGAAYATEPLPYAAVEFDAARRLTALRKSKDDLSLPPPKHVACGLYAAAAGWLSPRLANLEPNSKGEISLPAVLDGADYAAERIFAFPLPATEWFGVNTPEELSQARSRLQAT